MSRGRIALVVLAGVMSVALTVGVVAIGWHYARPKLPAVGVVEASADAGIVAVVDAAGDRAAVTVTQLVATATCEHTMFAQGHIYTRTANLYPDAGQENALIDRIAAGLPASYHPSRANTLGAPIAPLHAQAGSGVQLVVQVISPGWISATTQTDCRASTGTAQSGNRGDGAGATVPADIAALYRALGTSAASWHAESVPCHGGAIATVDAVSLTTNTGSIAARLATRIPPGARRYATPSNRVIWRVGQTSTVVAAADDGVHITIQTTSSSC